MKLCLLIVHVDSNGLTIMGLCFPETATNEWLFGAAPDICNDVVRRSVPRSFESEKFTRSSINVVHFVDRRKKETTVRPSYGVAELFMTKRSLETVGGSDQHQLDQRKAMSKRSGRCNRYYKRFCPLLSYRYCRGRVEISANRAHAGRFNL